MTSSAHAAETHALKVVLTATPVGDQTSEQEKVAVGV